MTISSRHETSMLAILAMATPLTPLTMVPLLTTNLSPLTTHDVCHPGERVREANPNPNPNPNQASEFEKIMAPLFKQIARCIGSPHFQ
eukprot:scaffold114379_cov36-Phaeocystis_antarctica.AAC.1